MGHYGPMIIDPAGPDPVPYDREHVIVLSDFSFLHPHQMLQAMKQQSGVFNYQRQTIGGLLKGKDQTLRAGPVGQDADGPHRHLRCHRPPS
jgi:FtsP/CotA-like multicopper oxidase with cupredoxin domain